MTVFPQKTRARTGMENKMNITQIETIEAIATNLVAGKDIKGSCYYEAINLRNALRAAGFRAVRKVCNFKTNQEVSLGLHWFVLVNNEIIVDNTVSQFNTESHSYGRDIPRVLITVKNDKRYENKIKRKRK